ncbi:MAG: hypothetical protein R3Y24_04165 [Eubacteriales bacterium]
MSKKIFLRYCVIGIFCIIVSGMISMLSTLNPWSVHMPDVDSAVWLSRGIAMKQGAIMYVDVWDHKGPILFVIQYLGLSATPHSFVGIWILEWVANCLTVFLLYKIARIVGANTAVALSSAFMCMVLLYGFYSGGNCVEMWALPFINMGLYIFVKYFMTEKIVSWEIIVLGICAVYTFLLNGNLISIWMAYIPIVFMLLIYQKQWKELKVCVISFLSGILIAVLPVAITLLVQGSMISFIEIYFGFNTTYTNGVTLMSFYSSIMKFAYFNDYFVWVHIICVIYWIVKEKGRLGLTLYSLWFTAIALLMLSMSGRGYDHYGIQLVPCMIIPATICLKTGFIWCQNNKNFMVAAVIIFLFWGRFEVEDMITDIQWTMDTSVNNYGACGQYEDYETINNWTGRFTEEELKTKVFVYREG